MKRYVIVGHEDEEFPEWTLASVLQAYYRADELAVHGDVTVEKRDGDEVVKTIIVPQRAPRVKIRKGYEDVPPEYRKNYQ